MRHGPPELALLSLHGSIEDALRGHALRQRLPAAMEPFPQLVDTLTTDARTPLEVGEADAIRRMHRLRARVAHGEQIAVTAGTVDGYRRLAARLLPRYGVLVIGPEDEAGPDAPDEPAPPRRRPEDVEPIPPRHGPERGRTTTRLARPLRERSVYPDDEPARYSPRPRRGEDARTRMGVAGRVDGLPDRWQRAQPWLLPLLIIVSIFLIGAAVSISLQQIRAVRALPTSIPAPSAFAPEITTAAPQASADPIESVNSVAPTAAASLEIKPTPSITPTAASGDLAVGRSARVNTEIPLNLRESPGTNTNIAMILEPDTLVTVVEGPIERDGFTWWKVRAANQEGWCAGEYLEPR
ncbi:SH3 domain-containing protein [Chloroflexales bacterium ZM16-3]|nr:SH3 domain-containing protein [Chloroflexales bacterium ZM16-3]